MFALVTFVENITMRVLEIVLKSKNQAMSLIFIQCVVISNTKKTNSGESFHKTPILIPEFSCHIDQGAPGES